MKKIIILLVAIFLSGCAGIPISEKSLEKKDLAADERRVIEIGSKLLKHYPFEKKIRIEIKDSPEIDTHFSRKWNNRTTLYRGLIEITDSDHELAMILAHEIVRFRFGSLAAALMSDGLWSAICGFPIPSDTIIWMISPSIRDQASPTSGKLGKVDSFNKKEKALITADFFAIMLAYQAGYDCLALIDLLERMETQYPNSQYYKRYPLFPGRKEWIKRVVKSVTNGNLVPTLAMCLFTLSAERDVILKSQEFTKEQLVNTASFMGFKTKTIQNLTGQEIIDVKIPWMEDPGFLVCNDKILRQAVPKDYPWHQKEEEPSSMDMIRGNF